MFFVLFLCYTVNKAINTINTNRNQYLVISLREGEMVKQNNLIKPNVLIHATHKKVSLNMGRGYNTFLFNARKQLRENPNTTIFSVKIKEFLEISNINGANRKQLENEISKLMDTKIEFNIFNQVKKDYSDWAKMNILVTVAKIGNEFIYELPSAVVNLLKMGLDAMNERINESIEDKIIDKICSINNTDADLLYTKIDMLLAHDFRKKYTLFFFEFLKSYESSPQVPEVTIQKIREFAGIEDELYVRYADLDRKVIKPSIEELNNQCLNGKITFYTEYETNAKKKTEKVEKIKFKIYSSFKLVKRLHELNLKIEVDNFDD